MLIFQRDRGQIIAYSQFSGNNTGIQTETQQYQ